MASFDLKSYNNHLLEKVKRNSVLSAFIKKHGFSDDFVLEHINSFYEACKSLDKCYDCPGLYACTQKKKGEYSTLSYDDVLINEVAYCKYELERRESENFKKGYVYSDIPDEYLNVNLDNIGCEDKASAILYALCSDIYDGTRNKGLYIYGNFGVGKTYMCYALLNSLVKKGHKVAFVKVDSFIDMMRKLYLSNNDEYSSLMNKIKKAEYLVLDDIGSEKVSAFSRDDLLFNILDYRMENKLVTIFTSNLGKNDLLLQYQYDKDDRSSLIKAKRLLERIDILSDDYVLTGINKRRKV